MLLPIVAPNRRLRRCLGVLLTGLVLGAGAAPAATIVELATGLAAGTGIDLDETNNHLYFLEWTAGTLKRMTLTPGCEATIPPSCAIATVATGFSHPQDVAVLPDLGIGYVTTRDDPGTTGALWRVDLATGAKALVTFNLGAPHQIALGPTPTTAYVVGFDIGRLWRIDLTTGVKLTVTSGLDHPIGLVINADGSRAFVTEQGAARSLAEISLTTGARIRDVATGLTAPFHLEWTDPAEVALYLVERDPSNRILRVDLVTGISAEAVGGLPFRPSACVTSFLFGVLYVTTNTKLASVALVELPLSEPVFLGVGHVPATSIEDGYATTDPGYFYRVTHSPFGGTLNIFGNLNNFRALGATHYRVLVSDNGGAFVPLALSWNAYWWNPANGEYELVPVAPVPGDDRYEIPPEYPSAPQRWKPPFLMMRWPSSNNGLFEFQVELWELVGSTWNDLTHLLPGTIPGPPPRPANSLILRIDNTPPTVDLQDILQHGTTTVIAPCDIVSPPIPNLYDFRITAYDANHHLLSYHLWAEWGKNESVTILHENYSSHIDAEGPYWWSGAPAGSIETHPNTGWPACCNCAHTFHLRAWKRTINGYDYILRRDSHQSVTLNNTGISCPNPVCP